jgi:cryptochrome
VPELAELPAKYIYEPWTANVSILKKAGVKLGVDYPRPIVDHSVVSKENMSKMKLAYDAYKTKGNQKTVDGSGPPKKKAKKQVQTKLK